MEVIRTQKSRIRFKDGKVKQSCLLMCQASNNLANQTLFEIKKHFKETSKMLSYTELEKKIRLDETISDYNSLPYNHNYKSLIANSSQQTIKSIYNEYASFFALLKKKKGEGNDSIIKEPNFKKKGGLFKIIYASKQFGFNKEKNELRLGISKQIKEQLGIGNNSFITHKLPSYIDFEKIKEVRIQPVNGGVFYNIEIVYSKEIQVEKVDEKTYLGVDLGINNLASCVNGQSGESFIIDGKRLKSYNQHFNKRISKLKETKDNLMVNRYKNSGKNLNLLSKEKKPLTNREKILFSKRANYVDNYMNQAVSKIVKYSKEKGINNIIVGENKKWKQKVNIGKINNQKFYSIPHDKFKKKLYYKAEENGIKVSFQEESYTSKCSFIDKETLKHHEKYLGKRIKRGLFRTLNNHLVNSDINGASNILRKYLEKVENVSTEFMENFHKGVCIGFVNNPLKLKLESHF